MPSLQFGQFGAVVEALPKESPNTVSFLYAIVRHAAYNTTMSPQYRSLTVSNMLHPPGGDNMAQTAV